MEESKLLGIIKNFLMTLRTHLGVANSQIDSSIEVIDTLKEEESSESVDYNTESNEAQLEEKIELNEVEINEANVEEILNSIDSNESTPIEVLEEIKVEEVQLSEADKKEFLLKMSNVPSVRDISQKELVKRAFNKNLKK